MLEHTTQDEGAKNLTILREESAHLLERIESLRANDSIGNPFTFEYPDVGRISPSTLRYMKVASDLHRLFGGDLGGKVAEIGVGYGGQMFVNDRVFAILEYHLFDLPPVLQLASKFLESFILSGSYLLSTFIQHTGDEIYDLVVSNYAFSEFPETLQRAYVAKILAKARRGYLTMNTGRKENEKQTFPRRIAQPAAAVRDIRRAPADSRNELHPRLGSQNRPCAELGRDQRA